MDEENKKEWEHDFIWAFSHLNRERILYYIAKWYGPQEFIKWFEWWDTYQGQFWMNAYAAASLSDLIPKAMRDWCRQALDHNYPGKYDWEKLDREKGEKQ